MNKISTTNSNWLQLTVESLRQVGYMVVEDVLDHSFLETTKAAMYQVQDKIHQDLGKARLKEAGELGVLRLMMKYDPYFIKFLEIPEVLAVVDKTVSETAVLHLQNGFILPSFSVSETPRVYQNTFHMDFRRVLNGYLATLNILFTIDEFTAKNGGTLVVPGTHQKQQPPLPDYLETYAVAVECPPGSMIVFDSTLWHAAGNNVSGKDRVAINHQFTRSYFKPQIDYVRALGEAVICSQPARTQQLLGYYTRIPTSLDEYYQPASARLYRAGQG
ncbi:MAG: hypothetical protein BWK78_03965 [Thiotrichaceae bacterium IS1]|nr:MAG: hypothetical protein BWK78_03965 [Thiotrichaceae bacterium IS1]